MITGSNWASKTPEPDWLGLVSAFHVAVLGNEQVVRGRLKDGLDRDSPEVRSLAASWPGRMWLAPGEDGGWSLVLVRELRPPKPIRWGLHLLLFGLTVLTTMAAGALMRGVDPFMTRMVTLGTAGFPLPTGIDWGGLLLGLPFSSAFLAILLVHELGHFFTARAHGVDATPPFFIPFPPYLSVVGSLGAFIRLRSVMVRRSQLLDVGASGPWASFLLSLSALVIGLPRSSLVPGYADTLTPFAIRFMGEPIWLGSGLVTSALAWLLLPGTPGSDLIHLHPLAFAGWLGMFITALNLLPLGQLDGGHILYAASPERQPLLARLFLLALLPLGWLWWGWWFWGFIAVYLSRGRLAHPPVLQPWVELDPVRRWLALGAFLIFFLSLPIVPIRV
jgi:hypothetical protein